jgi:Tol biopolymer transport system component
MKCLNNAAICLLVIMIAACGKGRKGSEGISREELEKESNARIVELRKHIEDEPNKMEWRYQLAKEYEQIDRNMEALKTYEEALQINPAQTDLKYNYADLALKIGERKKAFQAYKEILLGLDSQQYLSRIAPKFLDLYKVTPIVATTVPEAFGMYSADATKILYQTYQGDNWDIFEYNLASQSSTQITFKTSNEENPDYSADGKLIVYTSDQDDHRVVDYNQKLRDIYVYNRATNREVNLTANSSNDWRPRFSTDGKFISFISERNDLRDVSPVELYSHIFMMETDGSFQLEITKGNQMDGGPVMSGGETDPIYFDSNRDGAYAIYKITPGNAEIQQISASMPYDNVAPDLNFDNTRIAFFSDRDGNYEIYMMNIDGSNEQKLTSNPADDLNPIFSPDGRKILFHSDRRGSYDIYEIDLDQKNEDFSISKVLEQIDAAMASL